MIENADCPMTGTAPAPAVRKTPLLGPLSRLARQRKTWSPALLAGVSWRAVTNLGTHREVLRFLKLPILTQVVRDNPRFPFKYLTHDYLVRGFTIPTRASCFLHHYRRLHAALPDRLLRVALQADIPLVELTGGGHRFAIAMGLSMPFDKEGEMSLNLQVEGETVFLISFTIVPGWVIHSSAPEILLISRVQGMKGAYRQIRLATTSLHDVAPGPLLLAALQGIGNALGIGAIAGVSAVRQSSYTPDSAAIFIKAYDAFFTEMGILKTQGGFFLTPIPLEEKPLTEIKPGHKIRTREKRAFKQQIQSACASFFKNSPRSNP